MAVELLLIEDVPGLGAAGDIVRVADGYARNYLQPQKLATLATEAAQRKIEKLREERAKREAQTLEASRARKVDLEKAGCTVPMKVGKDGKLFGAVTAGLIAETFDKQGLSVDKHQIDLPEPIHKIGVYDISIRLHADVTATVKVWVVEE